MEQVPKYGCAKYEQYIAEDFERHRVFVSIDVFMEYVLHVPQNWKNKWRNSIKKIKCDRAFSIAYNDYCHQCGTSGTNEQRFYKPLVDMTNAVLDFSTRQSLDKSIKPTTRQRYLRNDPQRVLRGMMNDLSPDIVAVHADFLPHIGSEERKERCLKESNLTWAQPLQVLEVKPWGNALVDGACMPRLKVDGEWAAATRSDIL